MRDLLTIHEDLSYLTFDKTETTIELTTCDMQDDRLDLEFRDPNTTDAWVVCLTEQQIKSLHDALLAWLDEREEVRNSKTRERLTFEIGVLSDRIADLTEERASLRRALDNLS